MADFIYTPPVLPYMPVIYQDDDIAVFDKPAGLLSVPGRLLGNRDSLAIRALRVWPNAKVVHRLDMATSGVLVMALHKQAQSHLSRQFQQRQTHKQYLAEIWGSPIEENGCVDLPLRCDWPNRPRQIVDWALGKNAKTHWQVLERRTHTTIVALTPVTGRSHQLRVHMLKLGHAIIGDQLYAHPSARQAASRLHLHAAQLSFYHPITNHWLCFSSPATFAPNSLLTESAKTISPLTNAPLSLHAKHL
ncbi:pseudouridine synthase [Celerinatantimonas yamalensis]|uniref:Dual-specificity RNA pseudouridine synthase RluA n=1 Tax=Celerinatantimonas yamalensis TaxID=559956 RepID=A0ABW9GBI6_9GAMM